MSICQWWSLGPTVGNDQRCPFEPLHCNNFRTPIQSELIIIHICIMCIFCGPFFTSLIDSRTRNTTRNFRPTTRNSTRFHCAHPQKNRRFTYNSAHMHFTPLFSHPVPRFLFIRADHHQTDTECRRFIHFTIFSA